VSNGEGSDAATQSITSGVSRKLALLILLAYAIAFRGDQHLPGCEHESAKSNRAPKHLAASAPKHPAPSAPKRGFGNQFVNAPLRSILFGVVKRAQFD
jgi:hypothetical protein